MAETEPSDFLAGVIEGFYGPPWTQAERFELFDWMAHWGLNTYLYAPKDDLKHRAVWREPYTFEETAQLAQLILACQDRGLRFIYALSPGLDIRFFEPSDLGSLRTRFRQMLAVGCQHFALLFDDIPDRLDAERLPPSCPLASAQCHVANGLYRWVREQSPQARFFFCPTPYCGRMADGGLGGHNYLSLIGQELMPNIEVFWTGPEIISETISVEPIRGLESVLRRKPLIWDNLFANDYDGRRFYCGPYAGRPLELRDSVRGVLCNLNTELPLNFVPLHTFAAYLECEGNWDPRGAYRAGMAEWLDRFATIGPPFTLDDLILFGDCYYLPHEEGPEAQLLYERATRLMSMNPAGWGTEADVFRQQAVRLRDFCTRLTELRHRPLFHALSRRVWDLREELDLLDRYVAFKSQSRSLDAPFHSDFHLPATYRGGMVARLQRLLVQQPDGAFVASDFAIDRRRRPE